MRSILLFFAASLSTACPSGFELISHPDIRVQQQGQVAKRKVDNVIMLTDTLNSNLGSLKLVHLLPFTKYEEYLLII